MMCELYENLSIAVYDARGNGDRGVVPTITGDHENRITDYTAILCCNDRRHVDYHIVENHAAPVVLLTIASTSTHAEMTNGRISPTLLNRAGTGGNQLPILVLKRNDE